MSYFGTIYADIELPSRARAVYMYPSFVATPLITFPNNT